MIRIHRQPAFIVFAAISFSQFLVSSCSVHVDSCDNEYLDCCLRNTVDRRSVADQQIEVFSSVSSFWAMSCELCDIVNSVSSSHETIQLVGTQRQKFKFLSSPVGRRQQSWVSTEHTAHCKLQTATSSSTTTRSLSSRNVRDPRRHRRFKNKLRGRVWAIGLSSFASAAFRRPFDFDSDWYVNYHVNFNFAKRRTLLHRQWERQELDKL